MCNATANVPSEATFIGKTKLYSHDGNDSAQKKNQTKLVIYNFTW